MEYKVTKKDLIAFANNCPPDHKTKSLAWDPDLIAEMLKRYICGSIILTEEQMKLLKDHLDDNTHKDPIPISGTELLRGFDPKGKEFIARATNCTLRFEQPSEEQQKMIDESNKKMDEIMAPINAAIAECASKLTDKLPFGVVCLEVDNKVIATIQLEHTHEDERK